MESNDESANENIMMINVVPVDDTKLKELDNWKLNVFTQIKKGFQTIVFIFTVI